MSDIPAMVAPSLSTESDFDQLHQISLQEPDKIIAIFKHSTRCNISHMALKRLQKSEFIANNNISYYYVDVLESRKVSTYIAQVLGITHESPQLLLMRNGKCYAHSSHSEIGDLWLNSHYFIA